MCGIIGYLGTTPGIKQAYEGLLILKNRGYDSAGMCSISKDDGFILNKYATTPENSAFDLLVPHLASHADATNCILHSRWSVVGVPTTNNSHPHIDYTEKFSLVHNGIIENYAALKKELLGQGVTFQSETDTEVIVNLIGYYGQTHTPREAIDLALSRLEGTWGLVIQVLAEPDKLYCARHGSPLLIGMGDGFVIVSSEQTGFAKYVSDYISLNNNDVVELQIEDGQVKFSTIDQYIVRQSKMENFQLTPEPFQHWTLKEIHEQSESAIRAMGMGSRLLDNQVKLGGLDSHTSELTDIEHLIILGCGTSYHAGLYTSHLFRTISGFNTVQVIDGGEFGEEYLPKKGKTGIILLSQSGETKDLHRCVELAKEKKILMIGVINVVDSMIARETRCGVYLNAGREVGVASTKCFTSQVIVLNLIACWFCQHRHGSNLTTEIIAGLRNLPFDIKTVIENTEDACNKFAEYIQDRETVFILGKGENTAMALEGALKIKEIGYINCNGYSTASLKHGTYALLEKGSPVIMLLPDDSFYGRNNSVGDELKSRESYVLAISDKTELDDKYDISIQIPKNPHLFGVLANISMQLIAYYTALLKGNEIDCPKNLAKTVSTD